MWSFCVIESHCLTQDITRQNRKTRQKQTDDVGLLQKRKQKKSLTIIKYTLSLLGQTVSVLRQTSAQA